MPATKTTESAPAPVPGTNVKVTPEQLAHFQELATKHLAEFEETVTVRQEPTVEVTDADREYVRKAAAAIEANKGTWLKSELPSEIPGEIAAKILDQRYSVIRAAALELGMVSRRAGANESKHVLRFKVSKKEETKPADKPADKPASK